MGRGDFRPGRGGVDDGSDRPEPGRRPSCSARSRLNGAADPSPPTSDRLVALGGSEPLSTKLVEVHRVVREQLPFIARIAVAIADPRSATLKTYLHSSGDDDPLPHYQTALSDAPSLAQLFESRRARVINDLSVFAEGRKEHTRRILGQGYRASFTLPMFTNDVFFGFVFFNSYQAGVFTERSTRELSTFAHLLALMIVSELSALRALVATVAGALHLAKTRDPESGRHLDRMSRYARTIAATLAPARALSGEFVERVFEFAPLHDIGKIGISDEILLKKGPLTDLEWARMRAHPERGLAVIDDLLRSAGLTSMQGVEVLRNIVLHHHEKIDGSGYPHGLSGEAIPLEARIVAVADVFDALTSRRPYKVAQPIDEAILALRCMAGTHLDSDCVGALLGNREELRRIATQFAEDGLG